MIPLLYITGLIICCLCRYWKCFTDLQLSKWCLAINNLGTFVHILHIWYSWGQVDAVVLPRLLLPQPRLAFWGPHFDKVSVPTWLCGFSLEYKFQIFFPLLKMKPSSAYLQLHFTVAYLSISQDPTPEMPANAILSYLAR